MDEYNEWIMYISIQISQKLIWIFLKKNKFVFLLSSNQETPKYLSRKVNISKRRHRIIVNVIRGLKNCLWSKFSWDKQKSHFNRYWSHLSNIRKLMARFWQIYKMQYTCSNKLHLRCSTKSFTCSLIFSILYSLT